jgi:hypothetical protein
VEHFDERFSALVSLAPHVVVAPRWPRPSHEKRLVAVAEQARLNAER